MAPRSGYVSNFRGLPTTRSQLGLPADSNACGCLNTPWGLVDLYGLTGLPARNNIVITMRAAHVSLRQIGNSQGVVIPKPILAQLGLDAKAGVEMTIEDGALVLRRPACPVRTGWAEAARRIAEAGDDELVMGESGNAGDSELVW